MVGMSGKASEPRRGQSSQQKKAAAGTGGSGSKTQPPPEALHVANILGDGIYPPDLGEKMAQVMSMLPACSEEEVCIALHDYDFDTNKAISALLDSDPHTSTQGEWTTKKKSRRSKGSDTGSEFIIAPGDSRLSGRQGGGRGTSRAASQNVRENHGGSVSVVGDSGRGGRGVTGEGGRGRGGGKGRGGVSGRGRSSSGRRERDEKEGGLQGGREERVGQRGEREGKKEERGGQRGERGTRGKNRGPRTGARNRSRLAAAEKTGQEGSTAEEKIQPVPVATEVWEDLDPQPSTEWGEDHHHLHHHLHLHQTSSSLAPPVHPDPIDPSSSPTVDQTWDSEAESKESQPLFPEAFTDPGSLSLDSPSPQPLTSSSAQPTTLTATSTPPLSHHFTSGPHRPTLGGVSHKLPPVPSSCRQVAPVEFQTTTTGTSHSSRPHSRHKRLARSQIPSQPVEMPKGTYPEMSELGIAFGGLELQTPPTTTSHTNTTQQDGLLATPTTSETRYPGDPVTSAPYPSQFTDDSGVISIATSSSYTTSGKKLEAPPGLPHPRAAPLPHSSSSLPHSMATDGTMPHSTVHSGTLPHSVVPSGTLPHSVVPSGTLPHSVVSSGTLPHSVVPSGTLPHSIVSSDSLTVSGSLPHSATLAHSGGKDSHTVPLSTTQDTVTSATGPLATTTVSGGGVGQLLPPEPLSLPPSSLLSSMDLPPATEHSKSTFTTAPSASHQLLSQSFTTVSTSSVGTGGGVSELLSQTTPTSSVVAMPTSKMLTAHSSSHHHANQQQQLQAQLSGVSKHTSLQQQQQQQQQPMIYPYMLQHPLVMPMSAAYYDPNEMSRYQASVSMAYYQHPTTSDPAMATGMGRADHGGSGFGSEGATGGAGGGKYGSRGSDISTSTTPANPPHSQQQGVQQGQMSHAALFNPYYTGNVIYPMYPGYGMPGLHSLQHKPSGGSSYPGGGVNSYQAPAGAGFGYDEVGGAGQEYKMYGGMGGGLGKPHTLTSSSATDMSSAAGYKQHGGFDSSKTGSNYSTYSIPQGGYSFIPTGPVPLQMPPSYMAGHEGGGGGAGGRSQKHSNKTYGGSHGSNQLWSQQPSH